MLSIMGCAGSMTPAEDTPTRRIGRFELQGEIGRGPPTYSAGPTWNMAVQRSAHSFNLNSSYLDFSTGFQTQLGFIQSTNIRSGHTYSNYLWYPKHRKILTFGLETNQNIAFNHQSHERRVAK